MKIVIRSFRCQDEAEFTFDEGNIILLNGPSGHGKSTILWAIYWCLYGSLRNIQPVNEPNAKTEVTLEFPSYTIYRRKRPDLLQLYVGEKVYQDKEAQAIINENFGSKEVWLASSYLAQGQRNPLLSASNAERTELLNALSFSSEDPDLYISRIAAELKTITAEYTAQEALYNSQVEQLEKKLADRPVKEEHYTSSSQLEELKRLLSSSTDRLADLQQKLLAQRKLQGMISSLTDELSQLRKRLSEISSVPDEELAEHETKINVLTSRLKEATDAATQSTRRQQLETNLAKLKPLCPPLSISVTEELVWKMSQQEKEYTQFRAKLKTLQLPDNFNKDLVEKEILTLQAEINRLNQLEQQATLYSLKMGLYSQLEQSNAKLDKMKQDYLTLDPDRLAKVDPKKINFFDKEIQQAYTAYLEAKKTCEVLECPSCHTALNYANGKLFALNIVKVTPETVKTLYDKWLKLTEEKKNYEKDLADLRQVETLAASIAEKETSLQELLEKYNSLETDHVSEEATQLSSAEIKKKVALMQSRLLALSSLNFIEKPQWSADQLRKYLELQKYEDQLAQLPVLSEVEDPTVVKRELHELQQKFKALSVTKVRHQEYSQREAELQLKLAALTIDDTLEPEISYLTTYLAELKEKIEEGTYSRTMAIESDRLAKEQERLVTVYEEMAALQRLHTLSISCEYNQLMETISNLNNTLNSILVDIFDDPIHVIISNFKPIKSDKNRVKANINMTIEYRGGLYEPHQLSGGEQDRLSLGLLLALNQVSGSPLVMLDEVCSSLDISMRGICLKVLEEVLGGTKTCIMVEHMAIEGQFGQVITL